MKAEQRKNRNRMIYSRALDDCFNRSNDFYDD